MQLLKSRRGGSRVKPVSKKAVKRVRKPAGALKREGAGRPSLYPGKDLSRHATAYLTEEGWDKLGEVQNLMLEKQTQAPFLQKITVSDVLERGIHRLHKELSR